MTSTTICQPSCPKRRGATKENPRSCHSDCETYLKAREERMQHYHIREAENDISDYSIREIKKLRKTVREV
jgi:hypothetical protein